MAYYIAVETQEKNYSALNIKKSGYFGLTNKPDQMVYECTLEEIDGYTTKFQNKDRLMWCLVSERILPAQQHNYSLAIVHTNGPEVRIVDENILYADSKKYLQNPNLVIEYIKNKIEENDVMFLRKLSSTLPETSVITYMIAVLATTMENNYIYGTKSFKEKLTSPRPVPLDETLISNIANALVYDCYING